MLVNVSSVLKFIVHCSVWASFHLLTAVFSVCRLVVSLVLGGKQAPPPQRLPAPSCNSFDGLLAQLPRAKLPTEAFAEGTVIAFEPCSNLCLYNFGVAACLQRATNFDEVRPRLCFAGTSSGAIVAAFLALNADICDLFPKCAHLLGDINNRVGGWIGAYSKTIRQLIRKAGSDRDIQAALSGERLRVNITELNPLPQARELRNFASQRDLEQGVLASCYIPVVWEEPIWLSGGVGPCLDGGATRFLIDGDFVFGPYHSNIPDLCPETEYPRQLVFQPVDLQDLYRLFEDGYRDALRWIENGCPSRKAERMKTLFDEKGNTSRGNIRVLLSEASSTFLEVAGIREKPSIKVKGL
eukprot:TRINITY_DN44855_c0_g1_i1.p1 TRINITY_DN44855_c0_g1~~TRINITY_DN44855_c0_g1_i1.p1  ORF type:complete len:354 (+),score=52.69 TRINITY_DN44855_c0_g1_i1:105-1166(+)